MSIGYSQAELIKLSEERFRTYFLDPKAIVAGEELRLARERGDAIDDPYLFTQIMIQVIIDVIDVNNKRIANQLGM